MGRVEAAEGAARHGTWEEGTVNRQPFIVGTGADKVLGFLAGLAANVLGLIATIAVMYIWAGSDPAPDIEERRAHAASVSIWSGIGCALPVILIVIVFLIGIVFLGIATGGSSMNGQPPFTSMPYQP